MKEKIKDKFQTIKEFASEHKKNLIITGAIIIGFLIVWGLGSSIVKSMKDEYNTTLANIVTTQNEITKIKNEQSQQQMAQIDTGDVEVKWNGVAIDQAKVSADNEFFLNFISPAFTYNSNTEYMEHRDQYIEQLGSCLFTTNILSPREISYKKYLPANKAEEDCSSEEIEAARQKAENEDSSYICKVTKTTQQCGFVTGIHDNSYDYIYFLYITTGVNGNAYQKPFIFTYTITNDTEPQLLNFECYAPYAGN